MGFVWCVYGLRIFDVADPFAPREIGRYAANAYLIGRVHGLDIIGMQRWRRNSGRSQRRVRDPLSMATAISTSDPRPRARTPP